MERQCLPSGRWFSCSSQGEADDAASSVDVGGTQDLILPAAQGWTNYSHCWADTTRKLMKDLNVSAGCPSDEQSGLDESSVSRETEITASNSVLSRSRGGELGANLSDGKQFRANSGTGEPFREGGRRGRS